MLFEFFKKIKILKFIIITLLIGCAGSSSNSYKENSLYDTNSTKISELKLIMVDGKTLNIKTDAGSFSRINGQTVIKLDSSEEKVAFTETQNKKSKTSYVTIVPEGNLYGGSFGLLGIDPQNKRLSNGEYIYNGNAEVFINDGNALYGLSGDSNIEIKVTETDDEIIGQISNLSGYQSFLDLSCRGCPIDSVATIVFRNGSICNGNNICFEKVILDNSKLSYPLTSLYNLETQGSFYGENSSEIGIVFAIDDTKAGSIEIKGALTGSK